MNVTDEFLRLDCGLDVHYFARMMFAVNRIDNFGKYGK